MIRLMEEVNISMALTLKMLEMFMLVSSRKTNSMDKASIPKKTEQS